MLNLLPQKYKSDLKKEYKTRRLIIYIEFLIGLAFAAIIVLIPFFILAQIEINALANEIEASKEAIDDEDREMRRRLSAVRSALQRLDSEMSEFEPSSIITEAIKESDGSIGLTSFSIKSSEEASFELVLSGVSNDRESLREFGEKLEANDNFERVDIPVSNFVKSENIDFSLVIYGK